MVKKSAAEYQREYRKRKRDQEGLKQISVMVPEVFQEKLNIIAQSLHAKGVSGLISQLVIGFMATYNTISLKVSYAEEQGKISPEQKDKIILKMLHDELSRANVEHEKMSQFMEKNSDAYQKARPVIDEKEIDKISNELINNFWDENVLDKLKGWENGN